MGPAMNDAVAAAIGMMHQRQSSLPSDDRFTSDVAIDPAANLPGDQPT